MAKILLPVTTLILTAGFGGAFGYFVKKMSFVFATVKR